MIPLKRLLKCKKGVTLVEIIVTLVLSVIIMTSVAAVLPRVLNLMRYTNSMAEKNTMLNQISNTILDDVRSTTAPLTFLQTDQVDIPLSNGLVTYQIGVVNGLSVLLRNDEQVLASDYYRDKQITFSVSEVSQATSDVQATTDTHVSYELSLTIKPKEGRSGAPLTRTYIVTPLIENQKQAVAQPEVSP